MKNRILVIEDDTAISELISMNLTVAGYDTEALFDGNEVEEFLKTDRNFDLALLDVMLPGKDGFELMDLMKEAKIPVIYLTAKSDVGSKIRGLRSGAEDYIVKPFEVLELLVLNPNKVYSRENLLNIVWGYEYPGDVRTVDVHIRRLREKIEANPSEPKYVHTKWGVGYYFQA